MTEWKDSNGHTATPKYIFPSPSMIHEESSCISKITMSRCGIESSALVQSRVNLNFNF